jgi:hypothetical protein
VRRDVGSEVEPDVVGMGFRWMDMRERRVVRCRAWTDGVGGGKCHVVWCTTLWRLHTIVFAELGTVYENEWFHIFECWHVVLVKSWDLAIRKGVIEDAERGVVVLEYGFEDNTILPAVGCGGSGLGEDLVNELWWYHLGNPSKFCSISSTSNTPYS